jgi:cyclopropane fatty-acyl-phospholipid synthase-like methyltransferase
MKDIEITSPLLKTVLLDHKPYVNLHKSMVNELVRKIGFKNISSIIDLGCGTGGTLKAIETTIPKAKIIAFELNENLSSYVKEEVKTLPITWRKDYSAIKKKLNCDLAISIETFEHNTDEEIEKCLSKIDAKYFAFSSTPHKGEIDEEWGHINIKETSDWIKIFQNHGYKVKSNLSITPWAILFEKV